MRGRILVSFMVCLVCLLTGQSALCTTFPLCLENHPDVYSISTYIGYDAGTDTLNATGFAWTLSDGIGGQDPITNGTFGLNATINDSGTLLGGTLNIGGTIGSYTSGTLLTGNLTDLWFPANNDRLEFMLDITGGDLAELYGGVHGGILLYFGSYNNFTGSFASSFNNLFFDIPGTESGYSSTQKGMPEPATLSLLTIGLIAVRLRRRR